jgi:hypothetical protein
MTSIASRLGFHRGSVASFGTAELAKRAERSPQLRRVAESTRALECHIDPSVRCSQITSRKKDFTTQQKRFHLVFRTVSDCGQMQTFVGVR